jgi:transcriptional regulator with XRE-family HTH domain
MARPTLSVRAAVRTALAAKEKNQAWLAAQLGVSESTVSRWLSGRLEPDKDQRKTLAELTGVPASRFVVSRTVAEPAHAEAL